MSIDRLNFGKSLGKEPLEESPEKGNNSKLLSGNKDADFELRHKKDEDILQKKEKVGKKKQKEKKEKEDIYLQEIQRIGKSFIEKLKERFGLKDEEVPPLTSDARIDMEKHKNHNKKFEDYVKINECLFRLEKFLLLDEDIEISSKIRENIFRSPLTLESFDTMSDKIKEDIQQLNTYITKKVRKMEQLDKDYYLSQSAELKLMELFNKFLGEKYITFISSHFDDIANKYDMFCCPLKNGLPIIVIDITLREKKFSKEIKLLEKNKRELQIEYGIRYKNGKFIQEKILDVSLWFYVQADRKLFKKYLNTTDEEEKEKIETEIFTKAAQFIVDSFEELKKKQKELKKDIKTLKKEISDKEKKIKNTMKTLIKKQKSIKEFKKKQKNIKGIENLQKTIIKEQRDLNNKEKKLKSLKTLTEKLKQGEPFIELLKEKLTNGKLLIQKELN